MAGAKIGDGVAAVCAVNNTHVGRREPVTKMIVGSGAQIGPDLESARQMKHPAAMPHLFSASTT